MNPIFLPVTTDMTGNKFLGAFRILNFVGSLPVHGIKWFLHTQITLVPQNRCYIDKEESGREISSQEDCQSCGNQNSAKNEGSLTADDVDIVMEKLGIVSLCKEIRKKCNEKCRNCGLLEDATLVLEKKEASMQELEEAFSVFDEDGDGFIDATELQTVMCRLEFKEGMNLDDCDKMIRAFDQNGDGRIDLYEFKKMLESAN